MTDFKAAILAEFLKRVNKTDGCWTWKKSLTQKPNGRPGYGVFCFKKKRYLAHRLSYELFIGPIPDGLLVCHRCNHAPCVNPAHLYAGTSSQNIRDALRDGLVPPIKPKKVCRNGHRMTKENTYEYKTKEGWMNRKCKTCRSISDAKYKIKIYKKTSARDRLNELGIV